MAGNTRDFEDMDALASSSSSTPASDDFGDMDALASSAPPKKKGFWETYSGNLATAAAPGIENDVGTSAVQDTAGAAAKTAVLTGQALVGLAEIAQGGADIAMSSPLGGMEQMAVEGGGGDLQHSQPLGQFMKEQIGYDPSGTNKAITSLQSDEMQKQLKEIDEAHGFGGTVSAMATNPYGTAEKFAENLGPMMLGGGMAHPLKGAPTMLDIGKGAAISTAGSQVEQIREETGDLTAGQMLVGAGSGALTGVITAGMGAAMKRLGVADIDAIMAGGATSRATLKGVLGSIVGEVPEEMLDSAQNQIAINIAEGKPWDQGVPEAAAQGAVLGGIGGGMTGAMHSSTPEPSDDIKRQLDASRTTGKTVFAEAGNTPAPEGFATAPSVFGGQYFYREGDTAALEQIHLQEGMAALGDITPEEARKNILGLVQTKEEAVAQGDPVVMVARSPDGTVVHSELVSENNANAMAAARANAQKAADATGGSVGVEDVSWHMDDRKQRVTPIADIKETIAHTVDKEMMKQGVETLPLLDDDQLPPELNALVEQVRMNPPTEADRVAAAVEAQQEALPENARPDFGHSRQASMNRAQEFDPNFEDFYDQMVSITGDKRQLGKPMSEVDLAPGTAIGIGEASDLYPEHWRKAVVASLNDWTKRFAPNAKIVVAFKKLPPGKVAAMHRMGNGTYVINPANLTRLTKSSEFNMVTQLEAGYSLSHELGHVIVEEEFFRGIPEEVRNTINNLPADQLLSKELIASLPEDRRAVATEYNEMKRGVIDGTMSARDFIDRWLGPAKAGRGLTTGESNRRQTFGEHTMGSIGAITLEEATAQELARRLGNEVLSFHEYMAEQLARYAYDKKLLEQSPLGSKDFFGSVLEKLRAFFKELKKAKLIKAGTEFTAWVDGLAARNNGGKQPKIKRPQNTAAPATPKIEPEVALRIAKAKKMEPEVVGTPWPFKNVGLTLPKAQPTKVTNTPAITEKDAIANARKAVVNGLKDLKEADIETYKEALALANSGQFEELRALAEDYVGEEVTANWHFDMTEDVIPADVPENSGTLEEERSTSIYSLKSFQWLSQKKRVFKREELLTQVGDGMGLAGRAGITEPERQLVRRILARIEGVQEQNGEVNKEKFTARQLMDSFRLEMRHQALFHKPVDNKSFAGMDYLGYPDDVRDSSKTNLYKVANHLTVDESPHFPGERGLMGWTRSFERNGVKHVVELQTDIGQSRQRPPMSRREIIDMQLEITDLFKQADALPLRGDSLPAALAILEEAAKRKFAGFVVKYGDYAGGVRRGAIRNLQKGKPSAEAKRNDSQGLLQDIKDAMAQGNMDEDTATLYVSRVANILDSLYDHTISMNATSPELLQMLRKDPMQRLVREELFRSSEQGFETVRFPSARTVAIVEGWPLADQYQDTHKRVEYLRTNPDPQFVSDGHRGIYDTYDKQLKEYLLRKMGGKEVVDDVGNTWIEVKTTPEITLFSRSFEDMDLDNLERITEDLQRTGVVQEAGIAYSRVLGGVQRFATAFRTIQQLAFAEPLIAGLQYMNKVIGSYQAYKSRLEVQATEVAQQWSVLGKEQAAHLAQFLQSEYESGKHLASLERSENGSWVFRPSKEFAEAAHKAGLDEQTAQLALRVKQSMLYHVNALEAVMLGKARKRYKADSAGLRLKVGEIINTFDEIRARPFLPQTRFGEYGVQVIKYGADAEELVHQEFFETQAQRDAAVLKLQAHVGSKDYRVEAKNWRSGARNFKDVPPELLNLVALELDLTDGQQTQLFAMVDASKESKIVRNFSRKLAGVTGRNKNLMRNYVDFMQNDSNLLAKLRYREEMERAVQSVANDISLLDAAPVKDADYLKRRQKMELVLQQMQLMKDYLMNPPQEWQGVKSFVVLWQLWGVAKTALANVTAMGQVIADATAHFGNVKGGKAVGVATVKATHMALNSLANTGRRLLGAQTDMQSPLKGDEAWAMNKAQTDGILDQTFAAQLANFDNAGVLSRLAGNQVNNYAQVVKRAGMLPIHLVEVYVRQVAFLSKFRLYMDAGVDRNVAYEMAGQETKLITGDSSRANRAEFMRGKKSLFTIYYGFTQQMMYLFSGAYERAYKQRAEVLHELYPAIKVRQTPFMGMTMRTWMIYLFLGGAMGAPGAEDIRAVLRKLGQMFFGVDFDIEREARKFVRELNEAGADLGVNLDPNTFMHGASHNIAGFDISSSVGFGRVIPGLAEIGNPKAAPSDLGMAAAGPLGGFVNGWLSALWKDNPNAIAQAAPAMPSAMRHLVEAYQWAQDGVHTRKGGKIVRDLDTGELRDLTTGELVGKGFGFTPTVVSQNRELHYAQADAVLYWSERKTQLMANYYEAIRQQDREAIADSNKALLKFNSDCPKGMQIDRKALMASLKGSAIQGAYDTAQLPRSKKQIPEALEVKKEFKP